MNSLVSTTSRSFSWNSSAIWAKVWNLYTVGAKMISRLSAIRLAENESIAILFSFSYFLSMAFLTAATMLAARRPYSSIRNAWGPT